IRSGSAYQISCGHGNLGVVHYQAGDDPAAADDFEKAVSAATDDDLAQRWRAALFEVLGRWGDALLEKGTIAEATDVQRRLLSALEGHEEEEPRLTAFALLRMAALLGDSLRTAEALPLAQKATRLYEALGDKDSARQARELEGRLAGSRAIYGSDEIGDV